MRRDRALVVFIYRLIEQFVIPSCIRPSIRPAHLTQAGLALSLLAGGLMNGFKPGFMVLLAMIILAVGSNITAIRRLRAISAGLPG
jgi:hypothetical protein